MEEAAGGEVGLGVVVDNGCSLEQELVDIWLKREHVPGDELCSMAKWSTHLFYGLEVYVLSQFKWVQFRVREVPYWKPTKKDKKRVKQKWINRTLPAKLLNV